MNAFGRKYVDGAQAAISGGRFADSDEGEELSDEEAEGLIQDGDHDDGSAERTTAEERAAAKKKAVAASKKKKKA